MDGAASEVFIKQELSSEEPKFSYGGSIHIKTEEEDIPMDYASEVCTKQELSEEEPQFFSDEFTHIKTDEQQIIMGDVLSIGRKDATSLLTQHMPSDHGKACEVRWNNIRDNYEKSLKRKESKSGPIAKKIKLYKYADQLNFLNKYFDRKNTKGEDADQCPASYRGNVTEVSNIQKKSRKKFVMDPLAQKTTAATLIKCLIDQKQNEPSSPAQQEQHPVDAFLFDIAPALKTLSPYQWHLAKNKLFATIQKFEIAALMEQKSYKAVP